MSNSPMRRLTVAMIWLIYYKGGAILLSTMFLGVSTKCGTIVEGVPVKCTSTGMVLCCKGNIDVNVSFASLSEWSGVCDINGMNIYDDDVVASAIGVEYIVRHCQYIDKGCRLYGFCLQGTEGLADFKGLTLTDPLVSALGLRVQSVCRSWRQV